jgi:3-hydroxybutyryl-CoA dehydrogenase
MAVIQNVTVVGAGTMGEGIAQTFAQGGLNVHLVDQDKTILERCLSQIYSNLRQFEKFGLLSEGPASVMERIRVFNSDRLSEAARSCQFILESVVEVLDVKQAVLAELDSLPIETILASTTGSFTVSALAAKMKTPQRVVGVHFFNPAHIIPLVEIHRGNQTTEAVVQTTQALMSRVGKKNVLVRKEVPGFIINRLTAAMEREVDYLLDEGIVTPAELDTAVKASFGFRLSCLGPQEAEDMIGLDISANVSARVFKTLSNRTDPSAVLLEKVKKGELGIKAGKGWYDYTGLTRQQVIERNNEVLLRQLAHFRENQKRENTEE